MDTFLICHLNDTSLGLIIQCMKRPLDCVPWTIAPELMWGMNCPPSFDEWYLINIIQMTFHPGNDVQEMSNMYTRDAWFKRNRSGTHRSGTNKHCTLKDHRGRILGRNPDKSPQSFPPCYSQSHGSFALRFLFLQLTQSLMYFFKLTQPLTYFYSKVAVHCKGKRRKTW